MSEIPEGYEPAQNAAAKDHVMEALYAEFEKQGINTDADENENAPDLIGLADAVVESLLKVGVVIPQNLESPYTVSRAEAVAGVEVPASSKPSEKVQQ